MKKIFLEGLPRWESGRYKGKINWKECTGCKVRFIHGEIEGFFEIVEYDSENKKTVIKYNDKHFNIYASEIVACKITRLFHNRTRDFKIEIGKHFVDGKRDLVVLDRKYRINGNVYKKWYKYICNKCIHESWIEESNLLSGQDCGVCCNQVVVLGINTIWDTDKWLIDIVGEQVSKKYTRSSSYKVKPKCPICGNIREKEIPISTIYANNGVSCPICGDGYSIPHKITFNVLKQLNVDFTTEYAPEWISPKRYDFYIPSMNLIIEADGGFHNMDNNMSGQTKEESKEIDDYKDEMANKHNIEVIRINCDYKNVTHRFEYIKINILKSKLSKLGDLNKIKWDNIYKIIQSNKVKECCDIKNSKPNLSTKEIAEIMKISRKTVIDYLKRGNLLKWCSYNVLEEKRKGSAIAGKSTGKRVGVFKDNKSLGIFESCNELERLSKDLFGISLKFSSIACVARKERDSYKGFHFKYVADLTPEEKEKYGIKEEEI